MSDSPIAFRNVTRYVKNVEKSVPLYEALGFKPRMQVEGFAVLQTDDGVKLILHEAEDIETGGLSTAIGFTIKGTPEDARRHVENAGWTLTRAPDEEDMGLFWIYSDLDGNRINLVGERPQHG